MTHLVYVAEASDGVMKIGISRDPRRRLQSLRYGPHGRCLLLHTERPPAGIKALHVEQGAHYLLDEHRVGGGNYQAMTEWFAVTEEQAIDAIKQSVDRLKGGDADFFKRPKSAKFQLGLASELVASIDKWRRKQPDLPSRSAAIRELVRRGLEEKK